MLSHKLAWRVWVMEKCSSESRAVRVGHSWWQSVCYSPAICLACRRRGDQPPAGEFRTLTCLSTEPVARPRRLCWKRACVKCWERSLGPFFPLCVLKEHLKHILGKSGYCALIPQDVCLMGGLHQEPSVTKKNCGSEDVKGTRKALCYISPSDGRKPHTTSPRGRLPSTVQTLSGSRFPSTTRNPLSRWVASTMRNSSWGGARPWVSRIWLPCSQGNTQHICGTQQSCSHVVSFSDFFPSQVWWFTQPSDCTLSLLRFSKEEWKSGRKVSLCLSLSLILSTLPSNTITFFFWTFQGQITGVHILRLWIS